MSIKLLGSEVEKQLLAQVPAVRDLLGRIVTEGATTYAEPLETQPPITHSVFMSTGPQHVGDMLTLHGQHFTGEGDDRKIVGFTEYGVGFVGEPGNSPNNMFTLHPLEDGNRVKDGKDIMVTDDLEKDADAVL